MNGETPAASTASETDLPQGWAYATLGEVLPLEYGKALPGRLRDQKGGIDVFGSSGAVGSHSKSLIEGPTIIVGRKGSAGAVFYSERACWPIDTAYFVRSQPVIDLRYGYYFLKSRRLDQLDQSTAIPSLSRDTYSPLRIPVAPRREQRRIVARIDELFTEITEGEATLQRARKDLDTWRRALLKAAVTGELTRDWRETNHPNETGADLLVRVQNKFGGPRGRRSPAEPLDTANFPEIPTGWAWGRLGAIGEVTGGLTKNPDREGYEEKLPFLRVSNVQMGKLDLTEMKEIGVRRGERTRLLLACNDLLIVEGNGSIDQIGRCALWADEIRDCVHQNHIIKARFSTPELAIWALRWLLSPSGRSAIRNVASSTSGLHTLSISKIENLPIPVPPADEAKFILQRLEDTLAAEADTRTELDEAQRSALAQRQSILKAAFEGRLVPQDPADEPASAMLTRLRQSAGSGGPSTRRGRARRQDVAQGALAI